jgi:hypothetical protein
MMYVLSAIFLALSLHLAFLDVGLFVSLVGQRLTTGIRYDAAGF